MAKTFDDYVVDQLAQSKKQGNDFAVKRKEQAAASAKTSDILYDTAISTAEKNAAASVKTTESGYRQMYDTNAVAELVARRNVEEAMANMGLTDSGLNRTQQTAISLQRGRADYQTSQQKQAAVDTIMRELDNYRAQNIAEKTAASRKIYEQADTDIMNYQTNADAAARQNAMSLYGLDREDQLAQINRDWQAQQAQIERDWNAKQTAENRTWQEGQAQIERDWQARQAQIERDWNAQQTLDNRSWQEKQAQIERDRQAQPAANTGTSKAGLSDAQIELALDYMDKTGAEYNEAVDALFGVNTSGVDTTSQKVAAMNSMGTPSYTAINAQAKIYSKTSTDQAAAYIEKQYNNGYINRNQRDQLLADHTKSGLAWARGQLDTRYDFNRRGGAMTYGTYENYVKTRLAELYNAKKITDQDFAILIGEFGVGA